MCDSRGRRGERPKRWKCTSECKLPTATEAQCIMATKALFEKPVQTLREGLNGVDECSEHGHYKHPLNADHEMPYYELAGHPLPCCSCERLFQRKQVTAFKFSEAKFSSDIWKTLKERISNNNSGAAVQTHYVCQYCRPVLNKNKMPGRCVLNRLEVEPVPQNLQKLDPVRKQLIQRAKAFQAVIRLGTYAGKVPSYNSLKACKGTMFFLPLPLERTMETLEAVENKTVGASASLPDPEVYMYMIVNSKPSQKREFVWQSLINVDKLKGALRTLKNINWLYADLDENSLDDASRRVIESVSDTTNTMLEKVSVEDISSYRAYTIRRLDQCQSSEPDCEQYKLTDVKETAMSNKFKYLYVSHSVPEWQVW